MLPNVPRSNMDRGQLPLTRSVSSGLSSYASGRAIDTPGKGNTFLAAFRVIAIFPA